MRALVCDEAFNQIRRFQRGASKDVEEDVQISREVRGQREKRYSKVSKTYLIFNLPYFYKRLNN